MKLGIIGCLTGSAAALLFGGCAADQYAATDVYRGSYAEPTAYGTEPVYVEQRTVFLDRQPRNVAVYRTGDSYFYTYGGRRYTLAGYPSTRTTYRTARYSRYQRGVDRAMVRTGYTEDESTAFHRSRIDTPVLSSPVEGGPVYRTTRRTYQSTEPTVIGERVITPGASETTRVTERRVRVSDY